MSTWASLAPTGDYISAAEFDGKPVTITIKKYEKEGFEREDDKTKVVKHKKIGVVYFEGSERGWVLNVTNTQLLGAIWPTPEDAIGHKVTLAAEEMMVAGEKTLGIRVIGSPDLTNPIDVTITLPRKKPIKRKLLPTKGRDAGLAQTLLIDPEPDEASDPAVATCSECSATVPLAADATIEDMKNFVCKECGGSDWR